MKVVTLNREEFGRACKRLFLEVMAVELWPDVIIGITRGGEEVMNVLAPDFKGVSMYAVKCSRPTSRNKKFLSPVLRYLPAQVNVLLRQIEARFLVRHPNPERLLQTPLADDLSDKFSCPKVLIIDDAVDSGNTLKCVESEVKRVWPGAKVWTAALTVTTLNPVRRPEIMLYKIPTLIRFPWSADTKNE